jgi:hypothetical protein
MSTDQIAGLLFSVDKFLPADVAAGLRQHLRATNECMRTSELFKVIGSSRSGDASPMAQLQTRATQIARETGISEIEALAEAGRERPDLYERVQLAKEGSPR